MEYLRQRRDPAHVRLWPRHKRLTENLSSIPHHHHHHCFYCHSLSINHSILQSLSSLLPSLPSSHEHTSYYSPPPPMAVVYFFQDGALLLHRECEILVILATLAFFSQIFTLFGAFFTGLQWCAKIVKYQVCSWDELIKVSFSLLLIGLFTRARSYHLICLLLHPVAQCADFFVGIWLIWHWLLTIVGYNF